MVSKPNIRIEWSAQCRPDPQHGWPPQAAGFLNTQSLTQALRALPHHFSVQPLHLGECTEDIWLRPSENAYGAADFGETVFVRDVLLCLDGKAVVWARSMCAADSQRWRELLDCGTQPLGERLFDGSLPLQRSPFEFCNTVPENVSVPQQSAQAVLAKPTVLASQKRTSPVFRRPLAARRSWFDWSGETLGLVECFLPGLPDFLRR
ncbi:chorismate lyase [Neisseria sp. ZJ106]|uniref:Chorismate lyase n=1 Tax=Neisseria lisongii TaxID=2912188 RepID=A0ABY7RK19_9NEIS|nr:chorismate lyase [Neisseria lisongii]MCF7521356.1 chorismate lyase [Neisseria lisongii]WCL71881.1 chorismate lyase [Neisseria lisongii]